MDQAAKDRVLNAVSSQGYRNLFISLAKKADAFIKSNIIITVNDRCLIAFNQSGTKQLNQFSWLFITSIIRESNKLKFQFGKIKFSFEYVDENLYVSVITAIRNILTNQEVINLGFHSDHLRPIIYKPSCAENRIKERAALSKVTFNNNTMDAFDLILLYSQPIVNLNEIPDAISFLPFLLESLPFCCDLKSLTLSDFGQNDPFSETNPYTSNLNKLTRIELKAKVSQVFQNFIDSISKSEEPSSLFTLSFIQSEFGQEELNLLQQYILSHNLKCLEFHDAIPPTTLPYFLTNFLTPDVMNRITFLNLDRSRNLSNELTKMIPQFDNLIGLSFADCSLEISETIQHLSRLKNLRILDLSTNTFRKNTTTFPPSLKVLYLNSVNWCGHTLESLFSNLPPHLQELYVSDITSPQPLDYDTVFDTMSKTKSRYLTGLCWDGNKVDPRFFNYLLHNHELVNLSLSRCFNQEMVEQVNSFCSFLNQSRNIKKLVLRSDSKNFIGKMIENIIKAASQLPKLEFFDISGSLCTDYDISQIRRFFSIKTPLKYLIFDGTKSMSPSTIIDILRESLSLPNLNVSFPHNDFKIFIEKGKLEIDEFLRFRALFEKSSKPGYVYRYFYSPPSFPLYLDQNEIELLMKPYEPPVKLSPPRTPTTPSSSQSKTRTIKRNSSPKSPGRSSPSSKKDQNSKTVNIQRNKQEKKSIATSQNVNQIKHKPKKSPKTFDSEPDSYNISGSSDNEFFNREKQSPKQVVKPIRKNSPIRSKKEDIFESLSSDDFANIKNQSSNRRSQRRPINKPLSLDSKPKKSSKDAEKNTTNQPKKPRRLAASVRIKSTKGRKGAKKVQKKPIGIINEGTIEKVPQNNVNQTKGDIENPEYKPPLRNKKPTRGTTRKAFQKAKPNEVGESQNENDVQANYTKPNWKFPISMKYNNENNSSQKIAQKYSTQVIIKEIMTRSQPKRKKK